MATLDSRRVVINAPDVTTISPANTSVTTFEENAEFIGYNILYEEPGDWRYFGVAIALIVIVLGTAGNGLTVWAYGRNRNLQTSFNVLIANLCCVELVFSLVIIPLQLPGYIINDQPYPDTVCSVIGYFYYSSIAGSLQNLVAIAINRYVGIVDTKRYQTLFTGARLRLCVISIWVTAPILYLPVVLGGFIKFRRNSMRCAISTGGGSVIIGYYNMFLNILFQAGGLILLVVLYFAIIKKVNAVQKKLKTHKRSSFTNSSKGEKKKKNKSGVKINTPGTTSGEETPDEYRPSSLISGGFQFRPVKDERHHETSDSGHGSDHDLASPRSKRSDFTPSHASFITASEEPSPKPKKRMSLWQVLFRNKAAQEEQNGVSNADADAEADVEFKTNEDTSNNNNPPTPSNNEPRADSVILRTDGQQIRETRRKKSLSAPTLPSVEEIMNQSRKNSAAVAKNIPEQVREVNESELSPRLFRAFTIGNKYQKNTISSTRLSNYAMDHSTGSTRGEMLTAANFSNRLSTTDKALHTSLPMLAPPGHVETPKHTRVGTIARKIRDHKRTKKGKSQRAKERRKALRKRHAREKQLVYSSFAICIAFAVCILPTSMMHMIQVITGLQVYAAVSVVVGCISWLHAIVNPFIYGYMNHLYRKEFTHIGKELEQKIKGCFKRV